MQYSKHKFIIILTLLAVIGLSVPLLGPISGKAVDGCSGNPPSTSKIIEVNINLIDENGSNVIFKDLLGSLNLIYFGYSFCPDICPIDLGRNIEINEIIGDKHEKISTFFVTVDPIRDTPSRLKEYTDLLDESLIGLTGTIEQVEMAKKNFMVYGSKSTSEENYLVDHSTFTYLIGGDGKLLRHFKRQDTPGYMKKTIECLIETAENKNGLIQK